jgi:DNA-binding transcriptional ArsR family regulator
MLIPIAARRTPDREQAERAARFFKGLGDPTRWLILRLLVERERNVTELVGLTGSPQGRVSAHLGCLRWCGLVATRRHGRSVYYRLADARIGELLCLGEQVVVAHAAASDSCPFMDDTCP